MGDRLRRLLYPLVLPLIVGTVWLCGWVRQQDDRARHGQLALPAAYILSLDRPDTQPDASQSEADASGEDSLAAAPVENVKDEP